MTFSLRGKVLDIDLTAGKAREITIPEADYRAFLGGSGVAAKWFYDTGKMQCSPLAPEAPLFVMTGLLTGVNVPTACKASFCGRSPATGIWSESTVGGRWPSALRSCGFDGMIISGCSAEPVYLYLCEDKVELREAGYLWGKDVYATQEAIGEEVEDENLRVAAIGPAGERQVLIAGIIIDGHDARAAGRGGMGAVMGSKRLKAIAVSKGKKTPKPYDPDALARARREAVPRIREKTRGLTDYGTAGGVPVVEKLGDLPIRNWTGGSWTEGAARTSGQAIMENVGVGHYACYRCPIRCGKEVQVTKGPYAGTEAHGPEYETAAGFGAHLLNDDLHTIVAANDLCNRLGLDTMSTASVIAFAMELYEHGLIRAEDAGGLELNWGNGEAILVLVEQIGNREGIGEILSQGVRRAAAHFGPPAAEFAVETKGLEYAFHDPRAFTSMALVYATGNRGACHLEGLTYFSENRAFPPELMGLEPEYDPHGFQGKPLLAKTMQDYMGTFNALGLCKFLIRGHVTPGEVSDWVKACTGWAMDAPELLTAGERIFNLKRLINTGLGISRKDDMLPPRLLVHDRVEGAAGGSLPHLGKMLWEYYRLRGWSPEGIPTAERLEQLGLPNR